MTLTTGRNHSAHPGRRVPTRKVSGGFTLLELILVLALISMTLAMVSPSLRGFFASRQSADAAMRVVSLSRWARSEAVSQGHPCRLNVDPQRRACWVTVQRAGAFVPVDGDPGREIPMPQGAQVRLRTSGSEPTPEYVRFDPSGRSDTAAIEITGQGGEVFLVANASPTEPFRVSGPTKDSQP